MKKVSDQKDKIGKRQIALVTVIVLALAVIATSISLLGSENVETSLRHFIISQTGEVNIGIEVEQVAPNFVDVNDNSFSLTGHRDNVVVLDMMATWCGPCITEMDHLKELYTNYSAQGVVIMSIDIDPTESDEMIRQFKSEYGGDWIFASGPEVGITYQIMYIPTIYIIDKQGIIAYKNVGVTNYSTLLSEINKLL
ncbi:Thiol-disulfide oxidoreductase ResA [subsurface metagenome]